MSPLLDHIGNSLKALKVHLFGRGIMTLAMMGATLLSAAGVPWVLPVVAVAGIGLTIADRLYRESIYKDDMLNIYRDDIAKQLGIAPGDVTRAHLSEAAKSNEVIEQALTRQRHASYIAIGTAILSSAITVGLFGMFQNNPTTFSEFLKENLGRNLGATINFIGIGTLATVASLFSNGILQTAITYGTGTGKAAAHDRIMDMEFDIRHGRAVSKEQVYGVIVAADPKLQMAIKQQFGESYAGMSSREKANALMRIGVAPEMAMIAHRINQGEIRPGHLAYMLQDATNVTRSDPAKIEAEAAREQSNFVERLGLAPQKTLNYRTKITAERQEQLLEQGATR